VYTLKNYPIIPSSTPNEYNQDEFQDCVFVGCKNCGCVQLQNLIDPVKLYENSHNSTAETPTWKDHHILFSNFIGKSIKHQNILDVGGNSGYLYKYTQSNGVAYKILDICNTDTHPQDVEFIQGNCESFDFTAYPCVALSHTFEHLYSPRKFLESLQKSNVKSVYISIPNMDFLCESKNISVLHNEHTYYIDYKSITSLFSEFKYSLIETTSFKNHSYFFHFEYNFKQEPIINISIGRIQQIQTIFLEYENKMKNIMITEPCFICPAGHYGQKIYYYLKNFEPLIKGFLDNDPSKQGKRVYGTPKMVYSIEFIKKYYHSPISIILYAGHYTAELKLQMDLLHSCIRYIEI
jgi:hypothetical protein